MTPNKTVFLRLLDLLCLLIALQVSSWFMLPPGLTFAGDYSGATFFTVVVFFLTFYMLDCYSVGREDIRDSMIRVIVAVCGGVVGTGFIFYTFSSLRVPPMTFIFQTAILLPLCLGWRYAYYRFGPSGDDDQRIIFVGADKAGRARALLAQHIPKAEILGYLGDEGADPETAGPCLGRPEDTLAFVEREKINRVILMADAPLPPGLGRELLNAKLRGLGVDDMRGLYERLARRVPVDLIKEDWLLMADSFNLNVNRSTRRAKRACDVLISAFLLAITLPVMLLAALAVRLESPGRAIYSQRRVGLHEREFTVYKIRSMRSDAEKNGAQWASKSDPRITRVGKFIRKTRIDELPQLWNVLKGEMSLIGPRPERMEFVRELEKHIPYFYIRHTVKPGVTGWAQVCYPYGASIEDSRYKLEYDLYYVKHMSALLEFKIILKTIGVILFPKGAR